MEETQGKLKKVDKIISTVMLVFVAIMASLSIFFTYSRAKNGIVTVFGYSVCYVVTGSMEPTLLVGDVILIKSPASQEEIHENDIVTYKSTSGVFAGSYITHRVQEIQIHNGVYQYIMKGDANSANDTEYVDFDKVTGVYVGKIGFVQFVMSMLSSPIAFIVIVILPLLIIFVMQIVNVAVALKNKDISSKQDIDLSQIDEEQLKKYIEQEKQKQEKKDNE